MISFRVRVANVLEHRRTIRGGKTSDGSAFVEQVDLGWFLHLELPDGEPFGVAIGVGTEKPDVEIGQMMTMSLV